MPVPRAQLEEIAAQLYPGADLILPRAQDVNTDGSRGGCDEVLDLLRRRPCSIADIAAGLRLHPHEAAKCVGLLASEQKIRGKDQRGTLYYEAVP
jgi:hypothetical protein